jgi:hypothetical protein
VAAVLAASAGLMFRGQYFILLAPYAALLAGFTWQNIFERTKSAATVWRWMGGLAAVVCFAVLVEPLLLGYSRKPAEISRLVYGMNPFPEYQAIADYIRRETRTDERVVVVGSEPALYFLSDRRPASPYLCVYEMMKPHAHARRMQEEAIRCIEKFRPRCMVIVDVPTSWGIKPGADPLFQKWLQEYGPKHYFLDGVVDLISETETVFRWGDAARSYRPRSEFKVLVFKRKD